MLFQGVTAADYEAIDTAGYYSSIDDDNKTSEPYSYLDPTTTAKDRHKQSSNDYQALPELGSYEKTDTPYQYEVATASMYRNSLDGSILGDSLPDDDVIYEDPGYVEENIYAWFEEKKFRKIKKTNVGYVSYNQFHSMGNFKTYWLYTLVCRRSLDLVNLE